jgi:hypothetical protein
VVSVRNAKTAAPGGIAWTTVLVASCFIWVNVETIENHATFTVPLSFQRSPVERPDADVGRVPILVVFDLMVTLLVPLLRRHPPPAA